MRAAYCALAFDRLPASAAVDALRLAAGVTRVIRTRAVRADTAPSVAAAARADGFAAVADADGYIVVGHEDRVVDRLLALDRSPRPHEAALGNMLGYPHCCVTRVALEGERRIDVLAAEATRWSYCGPFWVIDPSGYRSGTALISHVPCSPSCTASLRDAARALEHLYSARPLPAWEPISRWARVRATR